MSKIFYITTAIDYTNAPPHIGHAYEKILADVMARDRRLRGQEVVFLTGVDQHGQKVQQSAEKAGISEKDFAEGLTEKFLALWEQLGISYDVWAATTDLRHQTCVREILTTLHAEGKITRASHGGHYSVRQEQFLTDKERGPDGSFGPEWGEVVYLEEENYYFRLAEHKDWLLDFINTHPGFVTPAFRQVELRNAVEKIAGDLCISRPKSRLSWGIELPFDPEFVTYVWFDALINYISFAGYVSDPARFASLWPADLHVIGKDILIPAHGVYWPIMLHALGVPDDKIPKLLVHGYINLGGDKVSKSLGNVVDPVELANRYGAGALRYYLMREASTGQDMEFSEERLIARYNSDLANGLGNLLNRTLNMATRYRGGVLKRPASSPLEEAATQAVRLHAEAFDKCETHMALEAASGLVVRCNTYVEETAPWKLAKDPDQADRLDEVLYSLAESLRILAILHAAVLPEAASAIFAQLQISPDLQDSGTGWGGLPDGHVLGTPSPVFPRIEA
ncbi:MAG: class I tRNA ligase family protein [Terrimicrobiaceae bacterium]